MTDYIYDARGNAVGYVRGRYIHELRGQAIGQLQGTHVHKLRGDYVGELHEQMVVDKRMGNRGNIGNPGNPGNAGFPGNPGNRGARNYGWQDVFHKLLNSRWRTSGTHAAPGIDLKRVFARSAQAHNLKVVGSNPTPAPKKEPRLS
jgi:hypothetical protein